MAIAERKVKHPYITIDRTIAAGQPVISGTRIRVMDIAIRYELMGWSADRIIDEYPHLKLEQIHDALSYYYERKDYFDQKFRQDNATLSLLRKKYPSKLKSRLG